MSSTFVTMSFLDPGLPMSELVSGKGREGKGRKGKEERSDQLEAGLLTRLLLQ